MRAPVIETLPDVGVTVISSWIFNCYVVHDGGAGRPLVVDVGLPRTADLVLDQLRHLGLTLDVDAPPTVAATHAHSDHVSGVPGLAARAPVALHLPAIVREWDEGHRPRTPGPREAARIAPVLGDQPFDPRALWEFVGRSGVAGYGAGGYRMPVEVAGFVADAESVPGAPDWVALHTSGHTDDSTSYWCAATRTLLSGDAVLAVGRRPWFNPEYVDAALHPPGDDAGFVAANLRSVWVRSPSVGDSPPQREIVAIDGCRALDTGTPPVHNQE
jgi:glyoxylase-like metal-dependent hydrolase (beta-lactamase superfamily II)